jgi:hypothetical protein
MDDNSEKRASERRICNALMSYSYFNHTRCFEAKILNCSAGGICFQSKQFLQPGATVCIRVKEFKSLGSLKDCEVGLRCMSVAEVKWCNEVLGADSATYGVGVKYQPPDY